MSTPKKEDFLKNYGSYEGEVSRGEMQRGQGELLIDSKGCYKIPVDLPFIIKLMPLDGKTPGFVHIKEDEWAIITPDEEKATFFIAKETKSWQRYTFHSTYHGLNKWLDYSYNNRYVGLYKLNTLDIGAWDFVRCNKGGKYLISSAQSRPNVPTIDSNGFIQMTPYYYPTGTVCRAELLSNEFEIK